MALFSSGPASCRVRSPACKVTAAAEAPISPSRASCSLRFLNLTTTFYAVSPRAHLSSCAPVARAHMSLCECAHVAVRMRICTESVRVRNGRGRSTTSGHVQFFCIRICLSYDKQHKEDKFIKWSKCPGGSFIFLYPEIWRISKKINKEKWPCLSRSNFYRFTTDFEKMKLSMKIRRNEKKQFWIFKIVNWWIQIYFKNCYCFFSFH